MATQDNLSRAEKFIGAVQFLAAQWNVETAYEIDLETGRVTLRVWLPGTSAVLLVDDAPLGRIAVIEPGARFTNSRNTNCPPTPPIVETGEKTE